VCFCTLLGAAAQILMKVGMMRFKLVPPPPLASLPLVGKLGILLPWCCGVAWALITNLPLFSGYALYGLFTLLLVIALREGELSMLYPIISLGYVWVTALSYFFFHDSLNPLKTLGIVSIMIGVTVLGQGAKK
jgi:multidrug transporter EmrE-like cation transporter